MKLGNLWRGCDGAGAGPKADLVAVTFCRPVERHGIAVLNEGARLTGVECEWLFAAPRQLKQAAAFGLSRPRDCS